ncbi:S-adenosyl-L-methionine-dependent methyltransferase [Aspergillus pseudoustus]|uniref:S-adenosyl-L-methionine-dependent methyltransferase n=1 Tax=Aspergillus pseudoustus TaxID=1810923 RepID=A0ABR4K802_9EURO
MASIPVSAQVARILTSPSMLGFFPVAVHFNLFNIIGKSDKALSARDTLSAYTTRPTNGAAVTISALPLIEDTLLAMVGLGLLDLVDGGLYAANDLTRYLVSTPCAVHGGLHFSTEVILAASFFMRKLKAENFAYPFRELDTPMQYAYKLMGNDGYAKKHTYAIMASEGRMDSFNTFMVGKFGQLTTVPERMKFVGYDLGAILAEGDASTSTKIVDIGGGRGQLLLQLKDAFPQLREEDLIVQEYNDDLGDVSGVTFMRWNYKDETSAQPIKGALVYALSHVLHNLPNLNAARILQRIAEVMAPWSRLLVHEDRRKRETASVNCTMVLLFGGRERTSQEWHQLAKLAGLKVTFEGFPPAGAGVIEFRKA